MASVVKTLAQTPGIDLKVCVTAQHRQMLDQVLTLFEITPDYDLDIMRAGQSLADITSRVLYGIEDVLKAEKPDCVLVHGDTTTAMASTLAAFYLQIPVGHVEAGLRTGDLYRPWPEEMNRKVVDAIARWLFAPTEGSMAALLSENADPDAIEVTGNTVIDSLLQVVDKLRDNIALKEEMAARFDFLDPSRRLVLVTGHRRESFGKPFENICAGLTAIADRADVQLVYPVHLNENVRKIVHPTLGCHPHIHLIDPVDYLPFVYLMDRAAVVVTDSGGIQEEAPALGKPVLVTREVTERPEAIEAGTAILVGSDQAAIAGHVGRLLDNEQDYQRMSTAHNPYGDGRAAKRIVRRLQNDFGL